MSVTHTIFGSAAPAPAAVDVYTLTAARLWATAAALLGLAGAIIGGRALVRTVRRAAGGRKGAVVALVSGLIAAAGGVLNLAVADGGPGTGNGVVGGAAAVVAGLTAVVLGGLTLARARRVPAATSSR
ncbi:DUF6223 family protein [Amycolatopsis sp. NPDC051758]|uniref:DUF6223 family protein n=1 Tax=Amycolatopsis sp. NPDC051758 TaxID=3363935 RepID=UPI0037A0CE5F